MSDLQGHWYQHWEEKQGLFRSLVDSVMPLSKDRGSGFSEEIISDNVIKTRDGSLGDDDDDAREFLNDTLNQVRQEFRERGVDTSCPLSRLFECRVDYTIDCKECGNRSVHTEHYQDFRLDVPTNDTTGTNQETVSIGSLFPRMFDTQRISFPCEACFSQSTTVDNSIAKLPHVLVVQLKRFTPLSTHGYSKNRCQIRIDGSLDFELFCSPEALSQDHFESTPVQYLDEDQPYGHSHVPTDRLSSSWFSSASPLGHDDPFNPFAAFTEDGHTSGSYSPSFPSNPFALDGDEYSIETSTSQSYSYHEPPSEDEQYQWAMEESLRASQTLSQESLLDTNSNWDSVEGTLTQGRTHGRQSDDDEDPELKAAILASLMPDTTHVPNDKDDKNILEWEERELEKAISQSLIDIEDNKENISPEIPDGKKGKKGDKRKALGSSIKPTGSSTPRASSQVPASLPRANTVNRSSTDSDLRRKLKGKDKAPPNMRFGGPDESSAVFHLQAAVSHSDPEGSYVCDCLGSDGIWRCCDDQMTTVGTLDDLNRHRDRSGYLLFYVRD
ncbi:MAG: hypothetical protein J3Q66DRAFT_77402 [Benniella sp.]|nr:MAG: hypothetical protein J3Q66DRAFT_77402 [Benniella sp.]